MTVMIHTQIGGNRLGTKKISLEYSVCKVCGERTEREIYFPLMDGSGATKKKMVHCMCRCEREKREEMDRRLKYEEERRQIENLKQLSLLDAKSKSVCFSTYQVNQENTRAFGIAKRYVDNFTEMYKKNHGLLFWGDAGTGKSYTAAAIANELMERLQPVIMTSFVKLLQDMHGFDGDEGGYMICLNRAKLLIIDDLGAERGTDYALEKVYDIIDSRYRSGKPAIFTTNLTMRQMKECADIRYNRIYDRIFEMCYPVKFDGLSWRKREAAERYASVKKILEG